MRIRIKERDGLWMIKHINPKNLDKIKREYEYEMIDDDKTATTDKPYSPNPPLNSKISPHQCMYPDHWCYDCTNKTECENKWQTKQQTQ